MCRYFKVTTVTTAMITDIRTTIATDMPAVTDADEFELICSAEEKKAVSV